VLEDPALIDERPSRTQKPRVAEADAIGSDGASFTSRAIALWPRLDRAQLSRARGDPQKIARVITRRTALPVEAIVAILVRDACSEVDRGPESDVKGLTTDREEPLQG
jgi:hypothetical protein